MTDPCESQTRMGHLTSNLIYRRFPSYLLCTLLLLPFHLLPSLVHPTGFSFCFFPGVLAIFTLLSSNNNNNNNFSPGQIVSRSRQVLHQQVGEEVGLLRPEDNLGGEELQQRVRLVGSLPRVLLFGVSARICSAETVSFHEEIGCFDSQKLY